MGATCGHCALPVSREAQCSRPDCPLRKPPEARVPRFESAGAAVPSAPELVSCAEPKAPAPMGGMIGVQYRPVPGQQPWAIVTTVRGTLVTQERHPTQEAAEAAVPEVRRALRAAFSL
jgi:hypothetical protein